jgi:hypothetical protein
MAAPAVEYTPVTAPRGKVVHAVALTTGGAAACGARRPRGGWRVALRPLACQKCKRAIHLPV